MSLVVRISVNDGPPIELLAIRRVAGDEQPDSENLYEVRRFATADGMVRQVVDAKTVVHRYGDGAAVLARKALEATA
jgi:hypothetical protein